MLPTTNTSSLGSTDRGERETGSAAAAIETSRLVHLRDSASADLTAIEEGPTKAPFVRIFGAHIDPERPAMLVEGDIETSCLFVAMEQLPPDAYTPLDGFLRVQSFTGISARFPPPIIPPDCNPDAANDICAMAARRADLAIRRMTRGLWYITSTGATMIDFASSVRLAEHQRPTGIPAALDEVTALLLIWKWRAKNSTMGSMTAAEQQAVWRQWRGRRTARGRQATSG
ncbi:unnamed protein product [Vitrella brassicaformis CCMP3155]|uniref:Uncharacterized protein n=1 Tax=Vitrella brassicaformis (strain CCMP3155) TaxID=1169540 RepID=A0A0G4ECE2_VITBC|nr:unnamed protein product [Vitrella brassicaformis CCMP3155]|eukprot:CEL93377.1 unnamed protein product [Vitrella brassicaformis CCMP3155]